MPPILSPSKHDLPRHNLTLLLTVLPRLNHLIKRILAPNAPATLEHLTAPASILARRFYSSRAVIQALRTADAALLISVHAQLLSDGPIAETVPLVDCLVRGTLSQNQSDNIGVLVQRYLQMIDAFMGGECNSATAKQLVPLIAGLLSKFASGPLVQKPLSDWLGARLSSIDNDWTKGAGVNKYRALKVIEWAALLKCCKGLEMPQRSFGDAQVQAAYSKLIKK